jgi:heme exporter protein D
MSWSEFFAMGQYGVYVWSAYALAALMLCLNLLAPLWRGKAVRRRLQEYYRLHRNRDETET